MKKWFGLIEFPYPSGAGLHVGHPRSYTALDIIARKRRLQGYNVKVATEFEDIFEILKEYNPAVIILDAGNSETLKGLETCKKLKYEMQNLKSNIIFTTTVHNKEMVLNAGADLYLPKPYELSVIFGWIKKFNEDYNT